MPPTVQAKSKPRRDGTARILCGRPWVAANGTENGCGTDLGELYWHKKSQRFRLRREGNYQRRPDGLYGFAKRNAYPLVVPHTGVTVICPGCQFRNVIDPSLGVGPRSTDTVRPVIPADDQLRVEEDIRPR